MCDRIKINKSVSVLSNERTCHPEQQCDSLMCFYKSLNNNGALLLSSGFCF